MVSDSQLQGDPMCGFFQKFCITVVNFPKERLGGDGAEASGGPMALDL
jgi:hypothetical protein